MVDIVQCFHMVGVPASWGRGKLRCPFHDEKTKGAFAIYQDDRGGHFFCHSCHAHGDSVDVLTRLGNVHMQDAIQIVKGETEPKPRTNVPPAKDIMEGANKRHWQMVSERYDWYYRVRNIVNKIPMEKGADSDGFWEIVRMGADLNDDINNLNAMTGKQKLNDWRRAKCRK